MKKGFSLVEMLILIFIGISILTLIVGITVNSREFARTMGCVNNMRNIVQAIENYQLDYKDSPPVLSSLVPLYLKNQQIFHCPSDRSSGNSYEKFYVGRNFAEGDENKIFLACPRHFRGTRTVVAYLSYSVDIGKTKKVLWSGIPAEIGNIYEGGEITFEDGTRVNINGTSHVGILGSFTDTDGKIYSIIYLPEGENNSISVEHQGNSRFEVITPAVIAGVEGTKFNVINEWTTNSSNIPVCITTIYVDEGKINMEERNQGRKEKVNRGEEITVESKRYENSNFTRNNPKPPRKPPREKPNIIKKKLK